LKTVFSLQSLSSSFWCWVRSAQCPCSTVQRSTFLVLGTLQPTSDSRQPSASWLHHDSRESQTICMFTALHITQAGVLL
jgi:hypothetical protein